MELSAMKCASCGAINLTPDLTEDQAAVYWAALEDLTCLIEVEEGMEECLPVAQTLREVAGILPAASGATGINPARLKDLAKALEILAGRFEETLDREDLDL
jgi:hypothetical protein